MKKILLLAICAVAVITKIQAQVSTDFSKQITALITTGIDKIKGKEIEKGNDFTTYSSLLKLDEFKVSYTTSALGNVLRADYVKTGTAGVMDNIYFSFLETAYTGKDSKDYPQLLKGMMNSHLKRKIELSESNLKEGTTKKILIVEMDKENRITIIFLNK